MAIVMMFAFVTRAPAYRDSSAEDKVLVDFRHVEFERKTWDAAEERRKFEKIIYFE